MELISSGLLQVFEVTYDSPSLNVGMLVYDVTNGTPSLVGSVIHMTNVAGSNTYIAGFTPVSLKSYLMIKQVYTDGTFTTVDSGYAAGTETAFASNFANINDLLIQIQNTLDALVGAGSGQILGQLNGVLYTAAGPVPQTFNNQALIYQGGKAALVAKFISAQTLYPLNLTGIYDIQTCFTNDDGTELMISLLDGGINVIGNPILGTIQVNLTAAQTALLAVTDQETIEFSFIYTMGGDPIKVQIPGAYAIFATGC